MLSKLAPEEGGALEPTENRARSSLLLLGLEVGGGGGEAIAIGAHANTPGALAAGGAPK
jgi:hypothetical protein